MHDGNQGTAIKTFKEVQTRKIPYLHPNHKSRHLNESTNLYHTEHKETYVSKNIEVSSIWSYNNYSPHISKDQKIPQKINLGWSDLFLVRQFYDLSIAQNIILSCINKDKSSEQEDILNNRKDFILHQ